VKLMYKLYETQILGGHTSLQKDFIPKMVPGSLHLYKF
jgi:hypothetical protein